MDFIVDGLATGRMVRILSVVDAYTCECLALEADTSLGSGRVTRVLERLIATVNQSVGVSLWKRAVKTGISDDQVGAVISIGFNLGLDMELGEFMQRMAALPEGSGFQRIDVQQFIDLATARNEAANTTYQLYRSGATCLQAALDVFGNQLSTWYQRRLEDNRVSSSIQHPTYARNGWRSRYEVVEPASGRLCADLTSLMLAQYLGVLLPIVEAYRPIRIPHGTVLALASMREAVGVHQPTRITNLRGVQDAVLNQRISVIAASSSSPVVTDCLDIDYPVPEIGDVQGVSRPAHQRELRQDHIWSDNEADPAWSKTDLLKRLFNVILELAPCIATSELTFVFCWCLSMRTFTALNALVRPAWTVVAFASPP